MYHLALQIRKIDLVIVNRANTYEGENTPMRGLVGLFGKILDARTGDASTEAELAPLEAASTATWVTNVSDEKLAPFIGEWPYPAPALGMPAITTAKITASDGHLVTSSDLAGTFAGYVQPDGTLILEDSGQRYHLMRDDSGEVSGIADANAISRASLFAAAEGDSATAQQRLAMIEADGGPTVAAAAVVLDVLSGKKGADKRAKKTASEFSGVTIGRRINGIGFDYMSAGHIEAAEKLFLLNTRLYAQVPNTWDSLARFYMEQERFAESIEAFEKAIELDPDHPDARDLIAALKERMSES